MPDVPSLPGRAQCGQGRLGVSNASQGPVASLSIAQTANITTGATGPNGATVSDTLPAVTDPGGTPSTSCAPAPGTVFAIGTTTVTCTATDTTDANSPLSTTFTVTVMGAGGQLTSLGQAVQGVGVGLSATVALVQQELANSHPKLACATLVAFIAEVKLETPRPIPAGIATQLVADAKQIQSVLAC